MGNESVDPLLEMLLGGEVATAEELADQDREPDLDLVDPGLSREERINGLGVKWKVIR
jgi:hypothetical protein